MAALLRILVALAGAVLAWLIVAAIGSGTFGPAGAWLTSEPWGIVTLTDLYLGFLITAIVIGWFERSVGAALFWIVPLPFLGNLWTAIWFVMRFTRLRARLAA